MGRRVEQIALPAGARIGGIVRQTRPDALGIEPSPFNAAHVLPVLAYVVIITLMVALASGMSWRWGMWAAVLGALIFYVSDIFVARERFVSPGPINGLIGLPLYYAGQLLLAWSAGMGR